MMLLRLRCHEMMGWSRMRPGGGGVMMRLVRVGRLMAGRNMGGADWERRARSLFGRRSHTTRNLADPLLFGLARCLSDRWLLEITLKRRAKLQMREKVRWDDDVFYLASEKVDIVYFP